MQALLPMQIVTKPAPHIQDWLASLSDACKYRLHLQPRKRKEIRQSREEKIRAWLKTIGIRAQDVICFINMPPPVATIVLKKVYLEHAPKQRRVSSKNIPTDMQPQAIS
ncbi:MAG: hypothetical protein HYZ62_00600 [Candidatus Andersenbacteria bacterium]|nr:hypothetical protein [Candidatus Andersenbacteria bacterium]